MITTIYNLNKYMIKNLKTIGLIALFAITLFVIIMISKLNNNSQFDTSKTIYNLPEKEAIEQSIEKYLEKREKESYYATPESKLFCAANIHWQKDISDNEKIVFAINSCSNVIVINGDLRSEGGGGGFPLFKVQKQNNNWVVTDADNRTISPKEPITQDWVRDTEKFVPTNIKTRCFATNCFSIDGVIEKAAEYYQIKLPSYSLNQCKSDSDCSGDSICVMSGVHSNPGPNTCVKKCTAHRDCGIAHTCRAQCVRGENGCPETAQNICVPDLLHADLEKDPNSVIE